jgi:hypothetical protein
MKVKVIKISPRDAYTMLYVESVPVMPDEVFLMWRRHVMVTNDVASTLTVDCFAEFNPEPTLDGSIPIFQNKSFRRCD